MAYITPYNYYENNGTIPLDANWGSYQYVTLVESYNDFATMYVGNDKELNNVARHEILFHMKKGIKLLNFDALKVFKTIELEVGTNLKFILPSDYVNYVRISININGTLLPLVENRQANSALGYLQDNNENILFDVNGEILIGDSALDIARTTQTLYNGLGPFNGQWGWNCDGDWFFGYRVGAMYGLEPENANVNPTFRIQNGVIDFSSNMANRLVVLEYVSDGMANGDDSAVVINKLAEDFIHKHVKWSLLSNKRGVPEYVKERAKKERKAELNNTKIRLSNLHPSRLLMSLRGQSKVIKA
jgi:hypothetical protein